MTRVLLLSVLVLAPLLVLSAPSPNLRVKRGPEDAPAVPEGPITFKDGNIGVNFAGFSASAGLGGLLGGGGTAGGLHAEAKTPFGQAAGAGIGGTVAGGKSIGGAYAGATAGGGISAGAGLAGNSAGDGGVEVTKFAHKSHHPATYHKEVTVVEEHPPPPPKTTYIERTVIPQYEEKVIRVPSYEEKVVRVPTTIEKKIRVPVEPQVIERTVEGPAAPPPSTVIVQKEVHRNKHVHGHKRIGVAAGAGSGYRGQAGGRFSATIAKAANPQLINDIFNIPISTLAAVSRLVSGIVGGANGSVSVSKSYGHSY